MTTTTTQTTTPVTMTSLTLAQRDAAHKAMLAMLANGTVATNAEGFRDLAIELDYLNRRLAALGWTPDAS